MFSFESSARKDLARSLTKAGAPKVSQAVGEIESLVQQYHSRFIAEECFPDMRFIGEARELFAHADAACHALEDISPPTRIRLEEERLDRDEKLSLVVAASKVRGHAGVRKQIAEVGALARKIRRREAWAVEFARFARLHGVPRIRPNGSPHLRLFRALGVDRPASTLNRYASVVETCLLYEWSPAEIRRLVTLDGPEAILRDYPLRRRIPRRRP
jgi:hypothetical protein